MFVTRVMRNVIRSLRRFFSRFTMMQTHRTSDELRIIMERHDGESSMSDFCRGALHSRDNASLLNSGSLELPLRAGVNAAR